MKLTVSLPEKSVVSAFFLGVIQEDECKWKIQEGEWGVMLIIMKCIDVTGRPKTCCYLCTSRCNFWADSIINCNSPVSFLGNCTMKNTAFPSSTSTRLHWHYYSTGIHSFQFEQFIPSQEIFFKWLFFTQDCHETTKPLYTNTNSSKTAKNFLPEHEFWCFEVTVHFQVIMMPGRHHTGFCVEMQSVDFSNKQYFKNFIFMCIISFKPHKILMNGAY